VCLRGPVKLKLDIGLKAYTPDFTYGRLGEVGGEPVGGRGEGRRGTTMPVSLSVAERERESGLLLVSVRQSTQISL